MGTFSLVFLFLSVYFKLCLFVSRLFLFRGCCCNLFFPLLSPHCVDCLRSFPLQLFLDMMATGCFSLLFVSCCPLFCTRCQPGCLSLQPRVALFVFVDVRARKIDGVVSVTFRKTFFPVRCFPCTRFTFNFTFGVRVRKIDGVELVTFRIVFSYLCSEVRCLLYRSHSEAFRSVCSFCHFSVRGNTRLFRL